MSASMKLHFGELWLYLHFPRLMLEALLTAGLEDQPQAVIEQQVQPHLILCCNETAQAQGVENGLALSTALALCPQLKVLQRQPEQEAAVLRQMQLLAYRFSPDVIPAEPDGLWLELTRSRQLFQSDTLLLKRLQHMLQKREMSVHTGIAHTPAAARLLCGQTFQTTPPNTVRIQQLLAATELSNLQIPMPQQRDLEQLGLFTLGQLIALPRSAISRRFGQELMTELKQIIGEQPCLIPRFEPSPKFRDDVQITEGIQNKEALLFPMKILLQRLSDYLIVRQCYCREFVWRFEPLMGRPVEMRVQLSKGRLHSDSFLMLSRLQLDRIELPRSIERIVLSSQQFVAAPAGSFDLFGDNEPSQQNELIDKLTARLGLQALSQPVSQQHFLPEMSGTLQGPGDYPDHPATDDAPQPTWLLSHPLQIRQCDDQLVWRQPLKLLRGPQRLRGNWWKNDQQRDYYLACDPQGSRYWVFQDTVSQQWFIHGLFA